MSIYTGTSKIKNIYLGTTPVKEVYVGTTKVRPGYIYKYSYDFRNKSATDLTNEGWVISQNRGMTATANGLTATDFSYFYLNTNLSQYISKANKITMVTKGAIGYLGCRLSDATTWTNITGHYIETGHIQLDIYGTQIDNTVSYTSGSSVTQSFVLDFENKTYSVSNTLGGYFSDTLSDAEINNIKSNNKWMIVNLSYTGYLSDISITIE